MRYDAHLTTLAWADYELLDSGDNMKLERYGEVVVARPETQALWKKMRPELWDTAHATFEVRDAKGSWVVKKQVPNSWMMAKGPLKFLAKLTSFKHVGVFPEQEPNWVWLAKQVRELRSRVGTVSERGEEVREPAMGQTVFSEPPVAPEIKVLNLFGYTGVATLAAAEAGAFITHVDSSKQSLDWAHENARLTGIPEDKIRWLADDALAFVKREVRRGVKYEGIVLDPPAFGRGAKGEVWKIEEDLPQLLDSLKDLLAETPGAFFLINGYAAGYASLSFAQAVESAFGSVAGESGELHLNESGTNRSISAGIYVRFTRP